MGSRTARFPPIAPPAAWHPDPHPAKQYVNPA